MPNNFPTSADVLSLLDDLKIDQPSAARLDVLTKQGVRQFEKRTGWTPFLAASSDTTRYFDPNGAAVLTLDAGLISVTSVTAHGTPLVEGKDFWLQPNNVKPYQWMRLRSRIHGDPQSIAITGRWGYGATVPEDAWLCVLRMAALPILSEFIVNNTGGMVEWKQADASEQYGEQPLLGVFKEWNGYVDDVAALYQRVTVGS